ncbi:MAG: DnaD domain protein [Clostridia bacterium]|nr:DnaD domain protein [Clostridia bacterium]
MKYSINPSVFCSSFSFPSSVVDENLKLATASEIKVLLYFFRHFAEGVDIKKCADALGLTEREVEISLNVWCKNGIISKEEATEKVTKKVTEKNEKPNRIDVAKRGSEDKNFALILREAQMKFARALKSNESTTLLYIYDDLGLDVSVILYLLQYAFNESKLNIRFIEKTAVSWVNEGVETITDAERIVVKQINSSLAWKRCEKCFGIEHRKPSEKELNTCLLWFDEWKLQDEVLVLAYNVCVDTKSKFIFSYCAKILENWHKEGLSDTEDIKAYLDKNNKKQETNNYAGYDIDLFEKMLNSDD